jgi:hypothetical protein
MEDVLSLTLHGTRNTRLISLRRTPPIPRRLLEALDVHERVTFVNHDWGSGLGFDRG